MSRDAENSRNVSLTTVVPAVLAVIVIIVILICLWCSRKKDLSQCFLGRRRDRDGLSEDGIPLNQHNTNGRSFSGEGSGTASPPEDQPLLNDNPTPGGVKQRKNSSGKQIFVFIAVSDSRYSVAESQGSNTSDGFDQHQTATRKYKEEKGAMEQQDERDEQDQIRPAEEGKRKRVREAKEALDKQVSNKQNCLLNQSKPKQKLRSKGEKNKSGKNLKTRLRLAGIIISVTMQLPPLKSQVTSPAEDQKLLVNIPPPEGGAWNKPPSVSDHVDRKENDQESASPAEEQKLLVDIPPEEGAWNKPPSVSDHVDRKENDQESASPAEEQKLLVDIPPEEETEDETLTQKIEVTAKNLLKLKLCCECGAKADQSIDDENRNIGAQIQQLKLYKKDLVQIYRYITRDLSEIEIHDGWALTRGIVAREPNASCAQLLGALQIMGRKGDLTRYHEEFHSI
eukprot:gene10556-19289_t